MSDIKYNDAKNNDTKEVPSSIVYSSVLIGIIGTGLSNIASNLFSNKTFLKQSVTFFLGGLITTGVAKITADKISEGSEPRTLS
jgi:hypothetical protein